MAIAAVIGLYAGNRNLSSSFYYSDLTEKLAGSGGDHALICNPTRNVINAKKSSNYSANHVSNRKTQSVKAVKEHVDIASNHSDVEPWVQMFKKLQNESYSDEESVEALLLLQKSMLEKQWNLSVGKTLAAFRPNEKNSKKKMQITCSGTSARRRRMDTRKRVQIPKASATANSVSKRLRSAVLPELQQNRLKGYMNGVVNQELLTHKEVVQLSKKIKFGLHLEEQKSRLKERLGCEPSDDQLAVSLKMSLADLRSTLIECSLAREKLAMSNVRLVMSIAQRYDSMGTEMADLIQGGLIGLLRGIEKFDHSRGFKISTYVYWWIRQGVSRALVDNSRTLRLPIHLHERLSLIRNAKIKLKDNGITPSIEKIAECLNMSQKKVRNATEASSKVFSLDREAFPSLNGLPGATLHSYIAVDDLSPSTSSVMNLLAEIYSQEQMIPKTSGEKKKFDLNEIDRQDDLGEGTWSSENPYLLSTLAPRLWPFMRHSITSVRYSAIRTLERLLEAEYKRSIAESSSSFWPSFILGDTLRIVFQNLLLESNEEIVQCSGRVWRILLQCPVEDLEDASKAYFPSWLELATTPYGSSLDTAKMFWPVALPRKSHFKAAAKMRAVKPGNDSLKSICSDSGEATTLLEKSGDTSTSSGKIVVGADVDMSVTYTRVVTATVLGILASRLRESSLQFFIDPLWKALTSLSGVQRQVASMVLISWFKELKTSSILDKDGVISGISSTFRSWLLDLLACTNPAFPTKDSLLPYIELSRTYDKMRNEARQLYHATESSDMLKGLLSSTLVDLDNLSADDAINFASKLQFSSINTMGEESAERNSLDDLETFKQRLLTTSGYLKCVQNNLHVTVSSLLAAAVVWMNELPGKLNPIILPLMASIKREQEEILQSKAAEALAELIYRCMGRKPGPNDKLIKNLCSLTCMDPCETPQAGILNSIEIIEEQDLLSSGSSSNRHKSKVHMLSLGEDRSKVEGFISRRGSELALKFLCGKLGGSLFEKLPKLWDCLVEVLKPCTLEGMTAEDERLITQAIELVKDPQNLINNIQVVRSIAPMLHETLRPKLLTLLPCIFRCVRHSHIAVRLAASRCITTMAKSMTLDVMGSVIENVVPMLGDITSVHSKQGAGMLVSLLVQGLGIELVPYAPLLVVPLLRCMSDSDHSVRQSVTHSFATLVPLLPLARGVSPPVGLSEHLSRSQEDVKFLEQLIDNSHIDDYKLSTELKVTLRRYQQEGINWLSFLKRFNLHGILCDDMGLGKTLQASAIVASDLAEHVALNSSQDLPPSLIICPSTLVGHWVYEIEKFIDGSLLTTLQYVGSAQERISLRSQFNQHNVIVTSYDVIRKDVDYLRQLFWNYCILDEGHIIKNSKSKITVAVKQLKAQHRLILSGTPIQNNVLDLWSLFDFLMPGFLGTERQFHASYGKPLLAARDPKCSAKDAEAGVLAMEALHKQVMPFLLRRTKDEVLSDLPEKIIQDRYCDLSPVQLKLYEQFSGSHVRQEISSMVKHNESETTQKNDLPKASSHVFQALQYLLKLCSHPLLVFGDRASESLSSVVSELFSPGSDIVSELHQLHHSPKLVALQEILSECGIGVDSGSEGTICVGQHRVLIFAQHKALLDIIERDLFQNHMKNVTYLRLDGSVEPEKRFDIVKAFNSDPTIDVLLLTTHVGGLGLNLTSANTLVFMEHDWNPMRDHQAMDRAHRLGQRKVVNVHRLIMRGTLEEKVMSLQRFKVSVANAVINAENASLKTMNTDQLLDLFTSAESKKGASRSKRADEKSDVDSILPRSGKGLKAILGGLEELWDQSQYTEEYNLGQFLAKLNG